MTTAANTATARAALAELRTDLLATMAKCETAAAEAGAAYTADDMPHVLYAKCGMVVVPAGEGYRLWGAGDGMAMAAKFTAGHAARTAKFWNGGLNAEQVAARCEVEALPLPTALRRAYDEAAALVATLDARA